MWMERGDLMLAVFDRQHLHAEPRLVVTTASSRTKDRNVAGPIRHGGGKWKSVCREMIDRTIGHSQCCS